MYLCQMFLPWCYALIVVASLAFCLFRTKAAHHPCVYAFIVGASTFTVAGFLPFWELRQVPFSNKWIDVGWRSALWTSLGELPRYLETVGLERGLQTWMAGNAIPFAAAYAASIVLASMSYFSAVRVKRSMP